MQHILLVWSLMVGVIWSPGFQKNSEIMGSNIIFASTLLLLYLISVMLALLSCQQYRNFKMYYEICFTDDDIKWKHFPRYWPFVRGKFTDPRWIPCTKASDTELWCFFFICVWISDWVNNGKAGDLTRYRAPYDVIVMITANTIGDINAMCWMSTSQIYIVEIAAHVYQATSNVTVKCK